MPHIMTSITRGEGPICDFCAGQPVVWRFPVDPFEDAAQVVIAGITVHGGSVTDWLACEPCRVLVDRDARAALVARGVSAQAIPGVDIPYDVLTKYVTEMQQGFFAHRNGSAVPYP